MVQTQTSAGTVHAKASPGSRRFLLAALVGTVLSGACGGGGGGGSPSATPPQPHAVVGPACSDGATRQKMSFVHVGDLHGNFDLAKDKYSRIRAYYEKVAAENPYTLFTDAGDDHEKGSVAEQYSRGAAVTEVTVAMRFDVRTLGNHDFAWGLQHLLDFARDPRSLVLSSNTRPVGNPAPALASVEYGVIQAGCLRIGFFGMVSPPWNELDQPYEANYDPSLAMSYDDVQIARRIVAAHRAEVDLLVMVSHMTTEDDVEVVRAVPGIDLVLGGHSHKGPSLTNMGGTLVVQPDFYADGVTRVDLDVDLSSRKVVAFERREQPVAALNEIAADTHRAIADVLTRYAPDAQKPIAYLVSPQDVRGIARLAAEAGMWRHQADAALLDPAVLHPTRSWAAGELTTQRIIDSYLVERQKPDTPGTSAQYLVEVSGEQLQRMRQDQSTWIFAGPPTVVPTARYRLLLNKGAALNPNVAFPSGVVFQVPVLQAETWETLEAYGKFRTTACLMLDRASAAPPCQNRATPTVWTFTNPAARLAADVGPATLNYRDATGTLWGPQKTSFGRLDELGLPNLTNSNARALAFPAIQPDEGYLLAHHAAPNGALAAQGLVSDYTLIMDLLWPADSDAKWRAILQTNPGNTDDADMFVRQQASGGFGIDQYFGALAPSTWNRIAIVVRAAESGGTLQFFINGAPVGTYDGINPGDTRRWALGQQALLLTDDGAETARGFLAGLLFADHAMMESEIRALGDSNAPLPSTPR